MSKHVRTAPSVVLAKTSKDEKTGRTMGDEIHELSTLFEKAVDDAFKTLGEKVRSGGA